MSVVDAVAIEAVLEARADCADRGRAEAALLSSLAAARAPRQSRAGEGTWRLDLNIQNTTPGIKSADAQIRDDRGRLVAERTVSDKTRGACLPLVRAVSAWAQIVLDDELVRAHDEDEREAATPVPVQVRPSALGTRPTPPDADESPSSSSSSREPPTLGTWEAGTMLFLRNGAAATGGMFGVSPFLTVSFAEKWVVRPSLAYGTSTSRVPPDQSNSENFHMFGGRLDLCRRMPGNYIDHRGIELDACVGSDMAEVWSSTQSVFRASAGPSAVLRGEIGQNFGLEIRTMVGVNLVRGGLVQDLPPFIAAAELGGSVRFR